MSVKEDNLGGQTSDQPLSHADNAELLLNHFLAALAEEQKAGAQ